MDSRPKPKGLVKQPERSGVVSYLLSTVESGPLVHGGQKQPMSRRVQGRPLRLPSPDASLLLTPGICNLAFLDPAHRTFQKLLATPTGGSRARTGAEQWGSEGFVNMEGSNSRLPVCEDSRFTQKETKNNRVRGATACADAKGRVGLLVTPSIASSPQWNGPR